MAAVTYDEAMRIVFDQLVGDWRGPGTFCVHHEGQTDGRSFAVPAGAAEALIGNNRDFEPYDDTVHLVDAETGKYRMAPLMETMQREWTDVVGTAPLIQATA